MLKKIWQYLGLVPFLWVLALLFAKEAYAYLDPGTFSYIAQVLVAVFAGGVYVLAVSRAKVGAFLRKLANLISTLLSKLIKRGG